VHGKIELHPTLLKIIDTPQFQRLRRCKQLGHAGYVFQNATHSRFEHSIGVAYKAGKLVKRFMEKQPGLNVTTKDKLCVEIAALVHDLGHGPFSHQFEHVLHAYGKQMHQEAEACEDDLQRAKMLQQAEIMKKWCHEDQSIKMLDYLLQVNNIDLRLEENGGLDDRDLIFIKELIRGEPLEGHFRPDMCAADSSNRAESNGQCFQGRAANKIFLYEVVSSKSTGLDMDRLDYLQRDLQATLGLYQKIFERVSESAAVCTDPSGRLVIAYPEEEVQNVMETYTLRMSMYNKVYMHRKTLILDAMVMDILKIILKVTYADVSWRIRAYADVC
jgi:HD superfamily phosphohydrolase